MDGFIEKIKTLIAEYDEKLTVSTLSITLATEIFRDIRNYPDSHNDEQILGDMERNKSKIAMAAIEIDSKVGAENQLSHSENGISRSFSENLMAYGSVIGYVKVL